ncbi:protein of unknown function [Cupriavidus taiwanensis]|uniref:Uncharacterized protein n=1 Tax=Cupriavidus taiwanensis TaxID=164546 RepID=A0A375IBX5_9BURK|nr:protein of unknown function [Cupriavidus taiwanensis]
MVLAIESAVMPTCKWTSHALYAGFELLLLIYKAHQLVAALFPSVFRLQWVPSQDRIEPARAGRRLKQTLQELNRSSRFLKTLSCRPSGEHLP